MTVSDRRCERARARAVAARQPRRAGPQSVSQLPGRCRRGGDAGGCGPGTGAALAARQPLHRHSLGLWHGPGRRLWKWSSQNHDHDVTPY